MPKKKEDDKAEHIKPMQKPSFKNYLSLAIIVVSFVLAFIFFSTNLTGYAVAALELKTLNLIGGIFFITAIIETLIYVKTR